MYDVLVSLHKTARIVNGTCMCMEKEAAYCTLCLNSVFEHWQYLLRSSLLNKVIDAAKMSNYNSCFVRGVGVK